MRKEKVPSAWAWKPMSRKALWTESSTPLQKAIFNFRGMWISRQMDIRYLVAASAQGITSKASPGCTQLRGLHMTLRGLSPPPPLLKMSLPMASAIRDGTCSADRS